MEYVERSTWACGMRFVKGDAAPQCKETAIYQIQTGGMWYISTTFRGERMHYYDGYRTYLSAYSAARKLGIV